MRILEEGDLKGSRYTIFRNNEKLSVKFEKEQCEIHMKFRAGEVQTPADIKKGWSDAFTHTINTQLQELISARNSLLPKEDDYFPELF